MQKIPASPEEDRRMYAPFMFGTSEQELHYVLVHNAGIRAFPMHWHKEIEITYVSSGIQKLLINGTETVVKEGDAVIIGPDDSHFYFSGDAELVTIIFSIDMLGGTPSFPSVSEAVRRGLCRNPRTTETWKDEDRKHLVSLITGLDGLDVEKPLDELRIRSALFAITALAADSGVSPVSVECSAVESRVRERISKVFAMIEKDYSSPITLPEAAERAGYVPTYFSRVFKEYTGITFYDYLTSYRISRAKSELVSGRGSISEVALSCGFGSVKTFDRVFKEYTGISPLKFRKEHAKSGRKAK